MTTASNHIPTGAMTETATTTPAVTATAPSATKDAATAASVTETTTTAPRSCLICGVGGQGTVLASRIIAAAAMNKGLSARTAETIGMAQRGGSVVSHVRIGRDIASPTVPRGQADILLGFEPGEAAANLDYLKPDGVLIVCRQEITPVTAALGLSGYRGTDCLNLLSRRIKKCYSIDGDAVCRACGSSKVLNVAVVGALCASGAMDLTLEDARAALQQRLKPALLEMNFKALDLGAAAVAG